jgi:translation initiation factor IF-3
VRVIGVQNQQLGVLSLSDAINLARQNGVDLVEIAPTANPPVCRLVDYGKFRYELAKKEKEVKKHQHANKVKEIQLSPSIDPHDFSVKLHHAIDFLCEEMKVKVTLRFRGREMMHQEFGFQVVEKFLKEVSIYGHPDAPAKLIGKGINVMLSPLPRNKRAKHPRETGAVIPTASNGDVAQQDAAAAPAAKKAATEEQTGRVPTNAASQSGSFGQNPFANIDINVG